MAGHGSMTGKVFGGRYQINDRIGVGGMAEVYRAQDNVLGRLVAVKVMLPQYASDPDFTRRFRQEAASAANLQSPYIVNVYDWGQDDDTYYIVMEFVRGSDLKTAIQQRGAVNQRKVAEIGAQVCQALSVAHGQDIIHRDIKPQNIMVQPDGNVKVMDFGIARAKNSTSDKTASVLGTAHYISPEQAQGKDLTAASDIYSLGVVLYEAATGKLPFDGPDAVSVALKQVKEYPVAPRDINPDIDPALEDVILTALEKDPANRFATANDMRLALNDYLAGRAIGSRSSFTEAQTRIIGSPAGMVAPKLDRTQQMSPIGQNGNGGYTPAQGTQFRVEPEKKSKKGVIAAVVAVAAIVIIAAAAFAVMNMGTATGTDRVPSVINKTVDEATSILEAAGYEVGSIDKVYSSEIEADHVVSQTPSANSSEKKGTKVNLTVSQGTEQGTVPDLRNKTVEEAQRLAKEAGFTLIQGKSENSSEVEADHIIRQSPEAGTKADKGSEIEYIVSLGEGTKEVPYVNGFSREQATSTLQNAGFKVSVKEQYSNIYAKNTVIDQSIEGGEKAAEGTTITIWVSLGPEPTPDPEPSSSSSTSGGTDSSASSSASSTQ